MSFTWQMTCVYKVHLASLRTCGAASGGEWILREWFLKEAKAVVGEFNGLYQRMVLMVWGESKRFKVNLLLSYVSSLSTNTDLFYSFQLAYFSKMQQCGHDVSWIYHFSYIRKRHGEHTDIDMLSRWDSGSAVGIIVHSMFTCWTHPLRWGALNCRALSCFPGLSSWQRYNPTRR